MSLLDDVAQWVRLARRQLVPLEGQKRGYRLTALSDQPGDYAWQQIEGLEAAATPVPGETIGDLDLAGPLDGTEQVPIEQAGSTVRTSTQDIADLASGDGGPAFNTTLSGDYFDGFVTTVPSGAGFTAIGWGVLANGSETLTAHSSGDTAVTNLFGPALYVITANLHRLSGAGGYEVVLAVVGGSLPAISGFTTDRASLALSTGGTSWEVRVQQASGSDMTFELSAVVTALYHS